MKKAMATFVLVLLSSVALALPAPKDIEAAVKAGQFVQAETMLHEVVKEKPSSAKAHYELGQVLAREGRNQEARLELLEAQRLDPSIKFASDPRYFRDLLNKIPAAGTPTLSIPAAPVASPHVAPAAPVHSSFPWTYALLGGGALLVIWLIASRAGAGTWRAAPSLAGSGTVGGGGYGYGPGYGVPPQSAGSGVGGAVLGGLAGMAAGYGLAKVLEHGEENRTSHNVANDNGFTPIDSGNQPDYGNFDAGSGGDSWDAGDTSADDNNW